MSTRNLMLAADALASATRALQKSTIGAQAIVNYSAEHGFRMETAYGSAAGALKNGCRAAHAYLVQATGRLHGHDSIVVDETATSLAEALGAAATAVDARDWEQAYTLLLLGAANADARIEKLRTVRKARVA